jgi:membrane protein implicated in regulation of membrane protease activity
MAGWLLWVLVACGFGIGEALTAGGFFLAPFSVGALLAAAVAGAGAGQVPAAVVFVIVSMLTLLTLRPLLRSRLLASPPIRTGAAALVGKQAVVLERIHNPEGTGRVRIDGEVWSARSLDDQEIVEGARVEVVEIRGATALVME